MLFMKRITLARVSQVASGALLLLAASGQAQALPGTLRYSWVGNSFMNHSAKAWIPDEVRDLCVELLSVLRFREVARIDRFGGCI